MFFLICIFPERSEERRRLWPGLIIVIVLLLFAGWLVDGGVELGTAVLAAIALTAAAAEFVRRLGDDSMTPALATHTAGNPSPQPTWWLDLEEGR